MRLELGNGHVQVNPTAGQISDLLHALPGSEPDSFAILIRDEQQFMQCSGTLEEGFLLEYQDGSLDEHFQCVDHELLLASVIWAFQAYLADDHRWRTIFPWRRINVRQRWWKWW